MDTRGQPRPNTHTLEDVKTEDVKAEDVKAEDVKAEDVKPEDVKPEDDLMVLASLTLEDVDGSWAGCIHVTGTLRDMKALAKSRGVQYHVHAIPNTSSSE